MSLVHLDLGLPDLGLPFGLAFNIHIVISSSVICCKCPPTQLNLPIFMILVKFGNLSLFHES
jgi:hypothetical protein